MLALEIIIKFSRNGENVASNPDSLANYIAAAACRHLSSSLREKLGIVARVKMRRSSATSQGLSILVPSLSRVRDTWVCRPMRKRR